MEELFGTLLNLSVNQANIDSRFRRWHVEALLNQGADLLDRCLSELKDLRSLKYLKETLEISFKLDQLLDSDNIHKQKVQFERNTKIAQHRFDSYDTTQGEFDKSTIAAEKSTSAAQGEFSNTNIKGLESNLMALSKITHEKRIENTLRRIEKSISENDLLNAKDAESIFQQLVDKKRDLLPIRNKQINEIKDQITEAEKRLTRDYEDALIRSIKAREGLKEIYGYNVPLPNGSINPISELSIWNREAIEFIVAYQQLDQAFTKVLSVRGVLGETQWNLLATNQVSFVLNPSLFSQHGNVRFRGIGASITGNAGTVPWSIIVTLPGKAVYKREGIDVKVGQDDLPSCLIGKVENRGSFRPMEYCGTVSLMNASPIGQAGNQDGLWRIGIEKPEKTTESFSEINDIILEINVVGRPI